MTEQARDTTRVDRPTAVRGNVSEQTRETAPTERPAAVRSERWGEPVERGPRQQPTGWLGWVWFGGFMLILLGLYSVIQGVVALVKEGFYAVGDRGLLISDLNTWGWTHLAIGAAAVIIGVGVLNGATWARTLGVIIAGASALTQMAFINAFPLWSLLVIALDIIVIYALIMHGREAKAAAQV